MIKLGNTYFNEAHIVAISQSTCPGNTVPMKRFVVQVVGGQHYSVDIGSEEVQRRLEEAGLIEPDVPSAPIGFPPNEIDLLMDALKQGYYYAAKDSTGQIYAYRDLPQKGARCWNATTDDGRQTLRLHGEFAALSWDDESPLMIEIALEGMRR